MLPPALQNADKSSRVSQGSPKAKALETLPQILTEAGVPFDAMVTGVAVHLPPPLSVPRRSLPCLSHHPNRTGASAHPNCRGDSNAFTPSRGGKWHDGCVGFACGFVCSWDFPLECVSVCFVLLLPRLPPPAWLGFAAAFSGGDTARQPGPLPPAFARDPSVMVPPPSLPAHGPPDFKGFQLPLPNGALFCPLWAAPSRGRH